MPLLVSAVAFMGCGALSAAPARDCLGIYATLPELFESADVVFLGLVRSSGFERGEPVVLHRPGQSDLLAVPPERFLARVEILELFKGPEQEAVRVFEQEPFSGGHIHLEPDARYLFFLNEESWPTVCSGTRRVGSGGFEQGEAWVESLRQSTGEAAAVVESPWYLDSYCIARFEAGSQDEGYVRLGFHRVGSELARIVVGTGTRAAAAGPPLPRPVEIVLELDGVGFELRRPWEVWGNPPGDVIWGDVWALEAQPGGAAWSRLQTVETIEITVLGSGGEVQYSKVIEGRGYRRAWDSASACKPAFDLGSSFVFSP